jgi:hypothetical protein
MIEPIASGTSATPFNVAGPSPLNGYAKQRLSLAFEDRLKLFSAARDLHEAAPARKRSLTRLKIAHRAARRPAVLSVALPSTVNTSVFETCSTNESSIAGAVLEAFATSLRPLALVPFGRRLPGSTELSQAIDLTCLIVSSFVILRHVSR